MATTRPTCVVLDIDGVLADVRHRLHHLQRRPKDWTAFFAGMDQDATLPDGARLAHEQAALGHEVVYLTGRNETHRHTTENWLSRNQLPDGTLLMRPEHDRRPARLFKAEALRRLGSSHEITLVVDDDAAVVAVLRAAGWPVRHATWMPETADEQQTLFDAQEDHGRT